MQGKNTTNIEYLVFPGRYVSNSNSLGCFVHKYFFTNVVLVPFEAVNIKFKGKSVSSFVCVNVCFYRVLVISNALLLLEYRV